jgi:hypothetical protein
MRATIYKYLWNYHWVRANKVRQAFLKSSYVLASGLTLSLSCIILQLNPEKCLGSETEMGFSEVGSTENRGGFE